MFEQGLLLGTILGFLFSVLVLDRFYKNLMKETMDEIHKNYLKALEIQKENFLKNNENSV